ncbi:MAG: NADH-quinone oxidoreductase subunit E, partial [Rhodobacteraceae bacterium]|nr:NADH-quinone oxidoreductase subunit E [Paracoccaceae bacterium]
AAPRDGKADDLKLIVGIGPKLEALCNRLGFFHFDQIANWTEAEVAWVDENLEGFKGRVTRDKWVVQARILAAGGAVAEAEAAAKA